MNISSKMFVCDAYTFYNKLIYQLNLNSRVFKFQSVTICKKKNVILMNTLILIYLIKIIYSLSQLGYKSI